MSWIAYVGPFHFPWGDAGSRRVCGIARSLSEGGHVIVVGCGDTNPNTEIFLNEGETKGSIRYIGLGELPPINSSKLGKIIHIFCSWGERTIAWLDAQPIKPSHVFVFGGDTQYIVRLLSWCRKNRVRLIIDIVEWYDSRHMLGGVIGPFNISAKIALRYLYKKCDGIIVISNLLMNYYEKQGCRVIRIPPIVDVVGQKNKEGGSNDPSKITLVYAGTPGKKDLLNNIISGVKNFDEEGNKIKLLIIGPSVGQVQNLIGKQSIPKAVHILGCIPQADVAKYIRMADFSVLLREPLYFANAGFPTKFVESMTNGTPVIANLTSDLGLYLHDTVEGFVCYNHSTEAFIDTIQKAFSLSIEQRMIMRQAARQQAENSFDFRVYVDKLSHFLSEV